MKSNLIDNRQIRVFISSTFQDMQDERDCLFNAVFPKIRKIAEQRDVRIVEIDLRWGITYHESANGKVMQVCFEEINNCRPFFIGLLGDRYGWCPDITEMQKNPDLELSFPWVKEYISQGKSLTEMEMQYGALCQELQPNQVPYARFYIKADSEMTSPEQKFLKEQVRKHVSTPNRDYHTVDELGRAVEEDLMQLLDEFYPVEKCTPYEKELLAQKFILHTSSYGMVPKAHVMQQLNDFLSNEKRYCVLYGQEGCGKTSTLACWINKDLAVLSEYEVFYHFVGASSDGTISFYEQRLRKWLRDTFSIADDDKLNQLDFGRFVYNVTEGKKALFIIDGIDQFDEECIFPHEYLPYISEGNKLVISVRTDVMKDTGVAQIETISSDIAEWEHPDVFSDFEYLRQCMDGRHRENVLIEAYRKQQIQLSMLCKKDMASILKLTFHEYGKKLTRPQIDKIISDTKSKDPFTLRTLISSMLFLRTPEDMERHILDYCNANSELEYYGLILDGFEKSFGKVVVKDYLSLILVSRNGIPEHDLREVCQVNQILFSQVYYMLDVFVKNRFGYLQLINSRIANLVNSRYVRGETNNYRLRLVNYYLGRSAAANPIDRNARMWVKDLPYQCYCLSRYKDLYMVVIEPQVALSQLYMVSYGGTWQYLCGEIVDYWQTLLSDGYTLDVYFEHPEKYIEHNSLALCYFVMVSRKLHDAEKALQYALRAIEIYVSLGALYLPSALFLHMFVADIYNEKGQEKERKDILNAALDICAQSVSKGDISSYLKNIVKGLSEIYEESDDEKLALYEKVYGIYSKVADKDAYIEDYRHILVSLTYELYKKKLYEKALQRGLQALEISERLIDRKDGIQWSLLSNRAFDHYECARILQKMGRLDEAIAHCQLALYDYDEVLDNFNRHMYELTSQLLQELQSEAS